MVLNDVADDSGFLVEPAASLDAEAFGHGDLDALNVLVIPAGLDQRVGKTEVDEILDRLLAQIVVDSEDRLLGKKMMKRAVQLTGRGEIAAKRLFHDDAGILGASRLRQPLGYGGELAGRDSQVVERSLGMI